MEDCYPKWVYHKTEEAKVVQTKEEHDALKGNWQEAPFAESKESDEKAPESSSDQAEASQDSEDSEIKLIAKKKGRG